VVTVTSTAPAASAGEVAVIEVALFTVKLVAAVPPNSTAVAPVRFVPVIVTTVPPVVGPLVGLTAVTVGAPTTKVNLSAAVLALVPPAVVTVTSTAPATSAGELAVIEVALFTVKLVAAVPPNSTAVAPVRFVPVIVTTVPPVVGPLVGLTAVTVGAGVTNVNWSAAVLALVPPAVVTVTSTAPAASAGELAVIEVALFTVKPVAAVPPNSTAVAPVRFVPVIVTTVPPVVGPLVGLTAVTVGAPTTKVNLSPAEVVVVAIAVVTESSTAPAASAGERRVIEVALFTVKLVAAVPPNSTAVAPVRFVLGI